MPGGSSARIEMQRLESPVENQAAVNEAAENTHQEDVTTEEEREEASRHMAPSVPEDTKT